MNIELERTYLAKYLPKDLDHYRHEEILDIYIPQVAEHPNLRIRKKGDQFEMTKKYPVVDGDASKQHEFTIKLTEAEFNELEKAVHGKRLRKIRYLYDFQGKLAEIDVFQDNLLGLVTVDLEFSDDKAYNAQEMPDFCLIEVTQDKNMAGGMMVGKSYADLLEFLNRKGYQPLFNTK